MNDVKLFYSHVFSALQHTNDTRSFVHFIGESHKNHYFANVSRAPLITLMFNSVCHLGYYTDLKCVLLFNYMNDSYTSICTVNPIVTNLVNCFVTDST